MHRPPPARIPPRALPALTLAATYVCLAEAAASALKRKRISTQMGSIFAPEHAPAKSRHRPVAVAPGTGPTPAQLALKAHERGINHRRFIPAADVPGSGAPVLAAQADVVAGSVKVTPKKRPPPPALVDYASSDEEVL